MFCSALVGVKTYRMMLLILTFQMTSAQSWGASFFQQKSTVVNFNYTQFSGEASESWGTTSNAYGFEILTKVGNDYLNLLGGVGVLNAGGAEVLLDGADEVEVDISAYMTDINLGFSVNLNSGQSRINPYIGVVGIYEIINSKIDEAAELNQLKYSETVSTTGYSIVAGIEIKIGGGRGGGNTLTGEFRNRFVTANLHDQKKFTLNGISFILGYNF